MSYYAIRLGSVTVHTDTDGTFDGAWRFLLGPNGLTGWDAGTQDTTGASDHWSGVGQVASGAALGSRQIIIEGFVQGSLDHPGSVQEGIDVLSRQRRTSLVVAENARGLARTADVRLTQIQSSRISAALSRVTLNLTADDPLRYSAESRLLVNGANLLPNRGDATAFGRLTLTGPHGAISIVHPGGTWTFPALASGSRLVDFREGRVWNGNVRVFGECSGPAPRVLPGGSSWTVAGLGAGSAVLSRAEAWS